MSDDFQTARCFVEISLRPKDGAMKSSHGPLTPEDAKRMEDWPSGGLVQTSNALLLEALRQESYVMSLIVNSQGTEPGDLTPEDLSERVRVQVLRMVDHVIEGVAGETLAMVSPGSSRR